MEFQIILLVVLEKLKVDFEGPSLLAPRALLSTINPGIIISVVCSSTCGITRCVLTLRRRRASNGLQNLRNSLFTSGILSNTSTAIGSFFAWASLALLCNKTRSAIATGHFPLPPLQQVQDSNQNMQIFQAGNENFLDLNRQKLNYDSIPSIVASPCKTTSVLFQ